MLYYIMDQVLYYVKLELSESNFLYVMGTLHVCVCAEMRCRYFDSIQFSSSERIGSTSSKYS